MKRIPLCVVGLLACGLMVSQVRAQPSLTHAVPSAVAPGKTVELTLYGAKLDEPLSFWTSFPAKLVSVPAAGDKPDPAKRTYRVTLDANVPVGFGGIVVATAEGASDALLVLIDDLPSVADSGSNTTPADAQKIELPVAVDGTAQAAGSRFYKFAAKAGQRIAVEVIARRMTSPLDPVVWLRDANGRELLYADDDLSSGADCRFAYTIAADGEYLLELRDNAFQGGGRYRLRVGDFPVVSTPFPLGGKLGTTATIDFAGPAADGVQSQSVSVPAAVPDGRLAVAGKLPGGASSALVLLAASGLPEVMETESNDKPEQATAITLPCAVNGRFQTERDRDYYQFEAKKGQQFTFAVTARQLGSPSFTYMRLTNASGAQLAETGVSDAEDESFNFTFPADGTYRLMTEELLRRGGAEFTYRVAIAPNDGFSLALKSDKDGRYKFVAGKDGALAIDVVCQRKGYDGPITLGVESAAGEFQLYGNVIAEKQAAAKLIAVVPPNCKPANLATLRIVGKATIDGRDVTVAAGTAALVRTRWPQLAFPPAWLDGLLTVAIGNDLEPLYTATVNQEAVAFPQAEGKAQFTVALERKNKEFKDPLIVLVDGLPAGLTYEVKRNGNGEKETYDVTLSGPKERPTEEHTISVISYAELKGRGQHVLSRVTLKPN
jgi:hypothetical protein